MERIKKLSSRISEKQFLFFYLAFVFLWNFFIGLQGFSMVDEGWVATAYQQIFNDPVSVQYLFMYYLSLLVGGVWNSIFGFGGLLSLRILAVLVKVLTAFVVYKTLKPYVNRWCILIGMWLVICCSEYGILLYHHNHLTALMVSISIYCFMKTLTQEKPFFIVIAGFILGMNVFTRLPNVSMFALILVLIPYYFNGKKLKETFRLFGLYVIGCAGGVLFVFLLMLLLGHFEIFIASLSDGFLAANDPESTHKLSYLFRSVLVSGYLMVIWSFIWVVPLPIIGYYINKMGFCRKNNTTKTIINVFIILLFTLSLFLKPAKPTSVVYDLYTLSTIVIMYSLLFSEWEKKYLPSLIILTLYLLPLGSDGYVGNMGENCVWFAVPFTVGFFYNGVVNKKIFNKVVSGKTLSCILLIFLAYLSFCYIREVSNTCGFDVWARFRKTNLINNKMATTFTTEKNCEVLNPLLEELDKYVKPNDKLICFQCIATIHYLTNTRPYLKNPLPWSYTPQMLKYHLEKAELENEILPVIVRDKSIFPNWYEYYPNWNNTNTDEDFRHKNNRIRYFNDFINKHQYRVVWENEVFQILIPPQE